MRAIPLAICIALALGQLGFVRPVMAGDSTEVRLASEMSGPGIAALLAGAVALPLLAGDEDGLDHSLRTGDALVCTYAVTLGLKELTGQPRPDGSGDDSFPSAHASVAFAAATMAADRHPDQAPYWYGAAALIGWSRVRKDRHRLEDVLAGAALGYGLAQLELNQPRGLLLAPFIDPDTGATGVQATWEF